MGREVRRVPANWQHPKTEEGHLVPLLGRSFNQSLQEWQEGKAAWDRGDFPAYAGAESRKLPFEEWEGKRPEAEDYMPEWPEEQRTHYQMYENVSEGTPISPVMETPEELAQWLADNGANAGAFSTATYEQWLRVCLGGYAPSLVLIPGQGIKSGVEGLS